MKLVLFSDAYSSMAATTSLMGEKTPGRGKKEWGARDGEKRVIPALYWFNMWEKKLIRGIRQ